MYPNPYNSEHPYTGQTASPYHCPVCGSTGECLGTVAVPPMLYPPFDLDIESETAGGPLRMYAVTVRGFTTHMRLNDADAARYGDAAVLTP